MAVALDEGAFAVWVAVTALVTVACLLQALMLWALRKEVRGGVLHTALSVMCAPCCGSGSSTSASPAPGSTRSLRGKRRSSSQRESAEGGPSGGVVQKEWEVDVKKLRMKYVIGKGNFGEVWLATWLGSPVAVKTLLPKLQAKDNIVKRFMDEIYMMSILHHPNVVMFLGACTVRPNLCLVLEYCVHGSLHHFLKSEHRHGVKINMPLVYRFALDIARGVYYLHRKQSIVQRDLKARNILVDESLNAKVADFGLSRVLDDGEQNKLTACGTPAWTAPEVVRLEAYTDKVDVYSFGIILWELLTRDEPYGGRKGVQIAYAAAEQGLRPVIPSYCPEDYAQLMRECWADDPADRPTFAMILKRLFQMKKDVDGITAKLLAERTASHSDADPITGPGTSDGTVGAAKLRASPGEAKAASGARGSNLALSREGTFMAGGSDSGMSAATMGTSTVARPLSTFATRSAASEAVNRGIVAQGAPGGAAGDWDGTVDSDTDAGGGAAQPQPRRRKASSSSGRGIAVSGHAAAVALRIDDSDGAGSGMHSGSLPPKSPGGPKAPPQG